MSNRSEHNRALIGWGELDRGLHHLADELGATQSAREAQFVAALDELARDGWDVPTEDEALEAVEEL